MNTTTKRKICDALFVAHNDKQPCYFVAWLFVFYMVSFSAVAQGNQIKPLPPLSEDGKGHLVYNKDEKGNRIPDYSYSGYSASDHNIPDVPVKIVVPLSKGDATFRIQSAIDYVAGLPADKNGFKGTVLLEKGMYEIAGQLLINSPGVVLRGNGMKENGTILSGSGTDRQTLIRVAGINDRKAGSAIDVIDAYVPVNSFTLKVADPVFKVGDMVIVRRPSTLNWIKVLGTEVFGGGISALGWKPGERDILWDRKVVAVEGNTITLDAPLTTALDTTYGVATVTLYKWPGRISNVGIENLRCRSTYNKANPKDEAHRWMAITMENVMDAWVRQIVFEHFAGSAVSVLETAKRITVEDCKSLSPVSEIGGQRRYTFFTTGQQTLFQRCYAEYGYHDFAVGFCAPGPNAFVQCHSAKPYSFSGAIDSWASGVLFDIVNVDGNALRFANRGQDGQGAGWSAANSVFYQCTAAIIENAKPPTANNWAFGTWAQFQGDGYWAESNNSITPRSLFYSQLGDRLQKNISDRAHILFNETNASSSPSVEVAAQLTQLAEKPAPTLSEWIDAASKRQPISIYTKGSKVIEEDDIKNPIGIVLAPPMHIKNGWLVRNDRVVSGNRTDVQWWSGGTLPTDLPKMKSHITRFVPGRTGKGLTDDLAELTDNMKNSNIMAVEHNYGLWYDRRRDDHQRIRRMDGDVWAPFYEMPFARSGKDTAWDGLSKYDLNKYNTWYWTRLKKFANLADEKGLVLIHQNYFQHNIIEAGAHYADFPWRSANNINNTGFPEPVPYAGDKRIFMAEQFYDINHAARRKLHIAYIRQCLNNFKDNTGLIQLIGAEFTGPVHFVKFWLDVIKEWQKETGKNEIIGLSTTKDVQDNVLADPARAAIVDLIDIRQWHYQSDGTTYEPKGGQNLAPRQHARLLKPKSTSFDQVYKAVNEYRKKYPGKAVMYSADGYDRFGWAIFMAGGSMAGIPSMPDIFLQNASQMQPMQGASKQWVLGKKEIGYIIYSNSGIVNVDMNGWSGLYKAIWIDPRNGKELKKDSIEGGRNIELKSGYGQEIILWIHK